MLGSKSALLPKTERVVRTIRKARKAGDRASESSERFADYKYLRAVFRTYVTLAETDLLNHLAIIAPSELMTAVRADASPIRVILEASCDQPDLRIKSRWIRALEFAAVKNIASDDLIRFLKANGGIAGCADLASKTKTKLSWKFTKTTGCDHRK